MGFVLVGLVLAAVELAELVSGRIERRTRTGRG